MYSPGGGDVGYVARCSDHTDEESEVILKLTSAVSRPFIPGGERRLRYRE